MTPFDFTIFFIDRIQNNTFTAEDDCRIASYFAQGCCYVTGRQLISGEREMHHRNRKFYGGTDTAENTLVLSRKVHGLIHENDPYRARDLLLELSLTAGELRLVNQLRYEAHMPLLKWKPATKTPAA